MIEPLRSLRSSVPCTPAAISFSGANSRSASAMRRPGQQRDRAVQAEHQPLQNLDQARRNENGVRSGGNAQQRAVDIDEQSQMIGVCRDARCSVPHVFVLSHDIHLFMSPCAALLGSLPL